MTTSAQPTAVDGEYIQNRLLTARERQILRTALSAYHKQLESKKKGMEEVGIPTIDVRVMMEAIKGDEKRPGLIEAFSEQLSLDDEAQITLDDARRTLITASTAVLNAIYDLPDFPGRSEDTPAMQRFIQTWRDTEREEALMYALAANDLGEHEVNTTPMPDRVRQALARAREWAMTDEERTHWLGRGPWSVGFESKVAEGVGLWYANRETKDGEQLEVHPDRFDTERGGEACAARLNMEAYLATAHVEEREDAADVAASADALADPERISWEDAKEKLGLDTSTDDDAQSGDDPGASEED